MKRLNTFVILMFAFSTKAFCGGYVGSGTIRSMQNAYGGWIINTNGTSSNPDGCSKNFVFLDSDNTQYKELFSLLLSAYTAAKPVNINVNGCDANGYKKLYFIHSVWN